MNKPSTSEIKDAIAMAFEAQAISKILSSCMDDAAGSEYYDPNLFHLYSRANDAAGRLMVKAADVLDRIID
jgi:hypothetical protein